MNIFRISGQKEYVTDSTSRLAKKVVLHHATITAVTSLFYLAGFVRKTGFPTFEY